MNLHTIDRYRLSVFERETVGIGARGMLSLATSERSTLELATTVAPPSRMVARAFSFAILISPPLGR